MGDKAGIERKQHDQKGQAGHGKARKRDDATSSAPSFWSVRDSSLFPMYFVLATTDPALPCNQTSHTPVAVRLGQPRFAEAGPDARLCEWADVGVQIGAPELPFTTYVWEPAWAVDSPSIASPRANFPGWSGAEMELYLTAIQDTYCVARDTVTVRVDDCVHPWLSNAITPNGDDDNNAFYIYNLPPGCRFTVLDRNGHVLFDTPDYQNDWSPGPEVPEGVYLVRLEILDRKMISGWVAVLR